MQPSEVYGRIWRNHLQRRRVFSAFVLPLTSIRACLIGHSTRGANISRKTRLQHTELSPGGDRRLLLLDGRLQLVLGLMKNFLIVRRQNQNKCYFGKMGFLTIPRSSTSMGGGTGCPAKSVKRSPMGSRFPFLRMIRNMASADLTAPDECRAYKLP